MLVFWFLAKVVLLKVGLPLKVYQNTKFHDLNLTGASSAGVSEFWTSAILE
jgi:hypothetical protein